MILFIRDNECFEPRVCNYLNYFDAHSIDYHVLAWNRNGSAKENPNITFFQRKAEYGKRIANIPNKIRWMTFVINGIWENRKTCSAIHACDIDAIIPALLMGKILHKKVIFDIFDWISSLTGKGLVYKFVEYLQNYAYKHSDAVILCEEERKKQAKTDNACVMVLPNIPATKVSFDVSVEQTVQSQRAKHDIVISYVGVFDKDRGLEHLLESVSKKKNVCLNIAGFGVLDELIQQYAAQYPNIKYWGRVEYAIGQTIMKNSDLIAAMYYLTSPLHKYAAPNKYYESLVLGVPMLTTENTLVGAKVSKYNTGFALDESLAAIDTLLDHSDLLETLQCLKQNCSNTWENIYKNYYNEFMRNQYTKFICDK